MKEALLKIGVYIYNLCYFNFCTYFSGDTTQRDAIHFYGRRAHLLRSGN